MPSHTFTTGRIRSAHYDGASRQLDLRWDQGTIRSYRHVPQEVYRRLCSAPNPSTYWEDRIAEEYPQAPPPETWPHAEIAPRAPADVRDLFGGLDDKPGQA